jgi:hypothetical protein
MEVCRDLAYPVEGNEHSESRKKIKRLCVSTETSSVAAPGSVVKERMWGSMLAVVDSRMTVESRDRGMFQCHKYRFFSARGRYSHQSTNQKSILQEIWYIYPLDKSMWSVVARPGSCRTVSIHFIPFFKYLFTISMLVFHVRSFTNLWLTPKAPRSSIAFVYSMPGGKQEGTDRLHEIKYFRVSISFALIWVLTTFPSWATGSFESMFSLLYFIHMETSK